jgi:type III pantothenate kinase
MSATTLLIDLGNTRLKWVLASGKEFVGEPVATPWPAGVLPWAQWRAAGIRRVGIVSVVTSTRTTELAHAVSAQLGVAVRQPFAETSWRGLRNAYPQAWRLGIDRWMGLIGAYHLDPARPCAIVSAGTALTIDLLDAGGRHRGGLIAPGLAAMRAGLLDAAPGLAVHEGGIASDSVAINSPDAIASGCLQAALGLIEHSVLHPVGRMILLSGGDAATLSPFLHAPHELRPWLVLEGLAAWMQLADTDAAPG